MSSHRLPDGRFRNPWPASEPHSWRTVLRWIVDPRRRRSRAPTPARGSFPVAAPAFAAPRADDAAFTATWIGHSTVLLQLGSHTVITDPMFSQRAFPVPWMGPRRIMDPAVAIDALPPIDSVLISHNHYDHLDRPTVKRLTRAHPHAAWIVPLGVGRALRQWGARDVVEVDWWQQLWIHGLHVTATPARHFSARRFRDRNASLWCGWAFEANGWRCWFAGDTAYHPEFATVGTKCGPFDFVMIPVGAYEPRWFMQRVHANPEEAAQICQDVIAAHPGEPQPLMMGIHWGTFRLTDEPMEEPPRRAAASWRAAGLDEELLWIPRFGETRSARR